MSDTPPSFQIPNFDDDDTKRIVRAGELKDMARATAYLVTADTLRRGEMRTIRRMVAALLVLIPLAISGGAWFVSWVAQTLVAVQSDVRALTVEVHYRNGGRDDR